MDGCMVAPIGVGAMVCLGVVLEGMGSGFGGYGYGGGVEEGLSRGHKVAGGLDRIGEFLPPLLG